MMQMSRNAAVASVRITKKRVSDGEINDPFAVNDKTVYKKYDNEIKAQHFANYGYSGGKTILRRKKKISTLSIGFLALGVLLIALLIWRLLTGGMI